MCTSWVMKVPGTRSTPASIMLLVGLRTTMSCGCWIVFVTTLVSPPLTSCAHEWTSPFATISKAPVTMGRLKSSSATPTTRTASSRTPPTRSATIAKHITATGMWLSCLRAYVYHGPHPRRALELDLHPIQQTRLFCGPWLSSASQTGVLSTTLCLLPAKQGHHWPVLRLCDYVTPPPQRSVTSLPLAARLPSTWPAMIMT